MTPETYLPAPALGDKAALHTLSEVPTPFALIDGPTLQANIAGMQDAVSALDASLRPHFKTHRTPEIARLQRAAGAIGVTVATPVQLATVQRELACPVLVSSPLQADAAAAPLLREASEHGELAFSIQSPRSVELLRAALGSDADADVVIEVDSGCLRCGVDAADCGDLARVAAGAGFRVVGLFSYPGHSYLPGQGEEASRQERQALELGARTLRREGFEPELISAGSTPTMPFAAPGVATEYRPGTYVFGDRQQLGLGSVQRAQLALTIVATVITIQGDRIVLDAGGKALGRDAPRWLAGYGELAGQPEALITRLYDHHSVIEPYRGPALEVGERVEIIPNNANSAMALLRSAWLTGDGKLAHQLSPEPDR